MKEEKLRVLNMVAEGKISPEEGGQLIDKLEKDQKDIGNSDVLQAMEAKNFYIKVEPKDGKSKDQVSVKVPFALLKAGLNIAGLIPKEAQEKINSSMAEKGMSFNISDMKPENIQEIMTALEEFTVDIETDDSSVKIYCK